MEKENKKGSKSLLASIVLGVAALNFSGCGSRLGYPEEIYYPPRIYYWEDYHPFWDSYYFYHYRYPHYYLREHKYYIAPEKEKPRHELPPKREIPRIKPPVQEYTPQPSPPSVFRNRIEKKEHFKGRLQEHRQEMQERSSRLKENFSRDFQKR